MGNSLGCSCEEKGDTPLVEIKKRRSCTDVPILLAFIALWLVIFVLLSSAIEKGADPNRLVRGVDWNNRICGVDAEVSDKPFAAWPKIPLTTKLFNIKVCVSSCSETTIDANDTNSVFHYPLALQSQGYPSSEFLFFCLPINANGSLSVIPRINAASLDANRAIGDLMVTKELLGYSVIVAVLLAFFYIWFSKRFAGLIVWSTIVLVGAGGAMLSLAILNQAQIASEQPDIDAERIQIMQYTGYAAVVITLIFFLIIFALRKRIKIAVEIVKEAFKSISYMPSMVLFPIIPFLLSIAYFAFWIVGALYIFSVTTDTDSPLADLDADIAAKNAAPTTIIIHQWDETMQHIFAIHFFHLLWNTQFFVYFGYMVIAGCVANWYFTPYDSNGKKARGTQPGQLPRSAVRRSAQRAIRYHLGTIAFGALIIAIVQFIRAIFKYIEKQSKGNSRIRKAIFFVVQCCLKCLECCLNKLSKNAFVYCAIYGDSFCTSAWSSFAILWRNLARVAAINVVGNYIALLGKLIVSFGTAGIIVQSMTNLEPYKSEVSSPVLTTLLVFLLAFIVASIFMVIYETAVDTIFLCFLIDEEQNKGGTLLASKNLLEIINKYHAKSEVKAEQ